MPTSWHQASSNIMQQIMKENPVSVLDVGIGFGKYGVLMREALDIPYMRYGRDQWSAVIDGIEAFEGYHNPIHDYVYNTVQYKPLADCMDGMGSYDVILMIDVLEHFDKRQGFAALGALLRHTKKALIISTPAQPAPQHEYMGNVFEAHQSQWTAEDFTTLDAEADITSLPIMGNSALIVKLRPRL